MDGYEATSEDPEVRKRYSESILRILRPLSETEMPRIKLNDVDSDCSALSEPFSDLDESYILLDQRKKKAGAAEGEEMLLNQFTPEFRAVYDELSNERQGRWMERIVDDATVGEERKTNEEFLEDSTDFSPKFRAFIDELLAKCELKYHLEEKKRKEKQNRKDRRVRTVTSDDSFSGPDNDSLSGVWRMLDAVSEDDGFPMSDRHYNLYDDQRFEWLIREEIPWDQIEASKKKCEQWLKMVPTKSDSPRPK